jgi:hypothetical protein
MRWTSCHEQQRVHKTGMTAMDLHPIKVYLMTGQFIMVLLASFVDLTDGIPSKAEVETYIEKYGYLKFTPELLHESYDSKSEPKWKTRLAYARRDAIDRDFLKPLMQRDAWEISEKGRKLFAKIEERFRTKNTTQRALSFYLLLFSSVWASATNHKPFRYRQIDILIRQHE